MRRHGWRGRAAPPAVRFVLRVRRSGVRDDSPDPRTGTRPVAAQGVSGSSTAQIGLSWCVVADGLVGSDGVVDVAVAVDLHG